MTASSFSFTTSFKALTACYDHRGQNGFIMPGMGNRTLGWAGRAEPGDRSRCSEVSGASTLMPLRSEQSELTRLTGERCEQTYYIGRMDFLKESIMFNLVYHPRVNYQLHCNLYINKYQP